MEVLGRKTRPQARSLVTPGDRCGEQLRHERVHRRPVGGSPRFQAGMQVVLDTRDQLAHVPMIAKKEMNAIIRQPARRA